MVNNERSEVIISSLPLFTSNVKLLDCSHRPETGSLGAQSWGRGERLRGIPNSTAEARCSGSTSEGPLLPRSSSRPVILVICVVPSVIADSLTAVSLCSEYFLATNTRRKDSSGNLAKSSTPKPARHDFVGLWSQCDGHLLSCPTTVKTMRLHPDGHRKINCRLRN